MSLTTSPKPAEAVGLDEIECVAEMWKVLASAGQAYHDLDDLEKALKVHQLRLDVAKQTGAELFYLFMPDWADCFEHTKKFKFSSEI